MYVFLKNNPSRFTSVTAGAFVRAFVSTLLAGVVTDKTLAPHGITPLLAVDIAASIIKQPVGEDVVHSEHPKSASVTVNDIQIYNARQHRMLLKYKFNLLSPGGNLVATRN